MPKAAGNRSRKGMGHSQQFESQCSFAESRPGQWSSENFWDCMFREMPSHSPALSFTAVRFAALGDPP